MYFEMIKRFSLLTMVMLLFATSAFAENDQPKEKVVTKAHNLISFIGFILLVLVK